MISNSLHTELIASPKRGSRRLLIMLHGLGDSIAGYRWLPQALDFPWLNYLLVNAPDQYYGGYSWYDFMGDIGPGVERSQGLLFDLLAAQKKAGFPAKEIILGGFSQGCLMALEVGLRFPERLAGIIGISGYVCNPEKLIEELPPVAFEQRLLVTHGLWDNLVPFGVVREQIKLLKAAGLHIQWHEIVKAHTIETQSLVGQSELDIIRDFIQACYSKPEP